MKVRRSARSLALAVVLWLVCGTPAGAAEAAVAEIERTLRGRPAQALQALERLLPTTQGEQRVQVLLLRGSVAAGMLDEATVAQTAEQLDKLGSNGQLPLANAAAGLLRARAEGRQGHAGRADRMFTEALSWLPRDTQPSIRLHFLDQQASIKNSLGKLDQAVALLQECVTLADRSAPIWQRAEQRSALAYALFQTKNVEQALRVNREAAELARQAADPLALSNAMTVDSILYGALDRPDDELRSAQAAIALAREGGSKRLEVLGIANLADFYLQRGDYTTALQLSQQALPLAREVPDLSSEGVALVNAGLAQIHLGRHTEGVQQVREALVLEARLGGLPQMADIQRELGVALEQTGHLQQAWTALNEYRRLADEVFQRQHQRAVLELQEGFEAEQRQRELALRQTDNKLKEEQLLGHNLQQGLWALGVVAGLLTLALAAVLLRRMRHSNTLLSHTNAQLAVAGDRDPLTGLSNRRHLTRVMQDLAAQGSEGFEGSLLLIDIDHFKRINDRHGHAAGDAVLVELAARLRAQLRHEDLTVRWGGEEFLVLVRGMPQEQVQGLAQRLLGTIGGAAVPLGDGAIAVTASIGFATFPMQPARQPLNWERAIDLVDTALYLAKAHGRNRAYGVRSLAPDAAADSTTAGAGLEQAWRSGRADLTHLPGPTGLGQPA
jgi:diguanylate cyclase (GGDEF)-like protein